ncbi:SPOR domain-containing protein [Xanthomonas cerealis]|uniref:SPOR domain-containing protein n=1 Tax=Xanthomonas cerealis TaxID=3390025 RepID=UPI00083B7AF7|nr:SPOR domain-containing protein [Xanthomonas translucens]UKE47385.1 SPOR domain-containing protein [Xanthomonas translucens pv. cerealis]UKE69733.1 SPOR domain-containing protein [Xanthomonas translucens pv. pistacia]
MLVRALLVVLTILNLGVALWWATQPQTPAPAPLPALPAGVATLQLVQVPQATPQSSAPVPTAAAAGPSVADPAASAPAAVATVVPGAPVADAPASTVVPATASPVAATAPSVPVEVPRAAAVAAAADPAAAPVCLSLGPYPDRAAAQTAVAALGTAASRPRLREVGDDAATSFRVLLPTIGGEDGVKAAVDRIVAAGIRDYYPIREGDAGNAIALGQYRSREGAERRKAELARAGFNVDLIPSGGSGQSRWWLDLRADSAAQAAALRRRLGAPRQRALDCATLR